LARRDSSPDCSTVFYVGEKNGVGRGHSYQGEQEELLMEEK
jgi:hypothetical protein